MTTPSPHAQANTELVYLHRLSRGWSKKRLADEARVSPSHVSRVEAGVLSLAGRPLADYAAAFQVPIQALCAPFTRSPAEGTHFRSNLSAAEWKRDRLWAQANLVALSLGRLTDQVDLDPALAIPELDPTDFAPEAGEISVAQVLRRYWRLSGPISSMTELLEAAGVFVVTAPFQERHVDAVTIRADRQHPALIYIDDSLPADRMRMTLAHELGHLVMDAMTLASPAEVERRATAFASEFLAPAEEIGSDLDRVSVRTLHELDELRLRWGVSESSLVVRAHQRGVLSDYQYRSLFRVLNETGRMYAQRPGVAEENPTLAQDLVDELSASGFTAIDLDELSLIDPAARGRLFGSRTTKSKTGSRHLTVV